MARSSKTLLSSLDKLAPKRHEALAADVATFLRDDVGHAHSFSLDSDGTVRERAALVKAM